MHIAADPSGVTLTISEHSRWVRCFVLFFFPSSTFSLTIFPFLVFPGSASASAVKCIVVNVSASTIVCLLIPMCWAASSLRWTSNATAKNTFLTSSFWNTGVTARLPNIPLLLPGGSACWRQVSFSVLNARLLSGLPFSWWAELWLN